MRKVDPYVIEDLYGIYKSNEIFISNISKIILKTSEIYCLVVPILTQGEKEFVE